MKPLGNAAAHRRALHCLKILTNSFYICAASSDPLSRSSRSVFSPVMLLQKYVFVYRRDSHTGVDNPAFRQATFPDLLVPELSSNFEVSFH